MEILWKLGGFIFYTLRYLKKRELGGGVGHPNLWELQYVRKVFKIFSDIRILFVEIESPWNPLCLLQKGIVISRRRSPPWEPTVIQHKFSCTTSSKRDLSNHVWQSAKGRDLHKCSIIIHEFYQDIFLQTVSLVISKNWCDHFGWQKTYRYLWDGGYAVYHAVS